MSKAEMEIAVVLKDLFRRMPSVVGFSVEEVLERELVVANLETHLWPERSQELFAEVTVALLDLVDKEPAARELLVGRTFARTLH
jgi:hypothetical protein